MWNLEKSGKCPHFNAKTFETEYDDYVAVNDPAVIFNGNLNNSDNVFKLQYSDSDAVNATLSYDTKLWKTTLA